MRRNVEEEDEEDEDEQDEYEEQDECFQRVWVQEICASEKWKEKWLLVPIYTKSQRMKCT